MNLVGFIHIRTAQIAVLFITTETSLYMLQTYHSKGLKETQNMHSEFIKICNGNMEITF